MDIKLGASVVFSDRSGGKVTNVVVDRATKKVTHIVVENKKFPQNSTRLVPINNITRATQEEIRLRCTLSEVANMPAFIVTRYIQETNAGRVSAVGSDYFFPYMFGSPTIEEYSAVVADTGFDAVGVENVPEGEVSVTSGMEIRASDGRIGKLDELILDSRSGEVTHLLMREGHLWGKKEIIIPLSAVASAKGGFILLKLTKRAVEQLPAVPLKHTAEVGS